MNKPRISSIMNSKKGTASTESMVLDEDVILEIVVRLPLKCAIRCTVLNKNLYRLISQRKKALVPLSYPDIEESIFCCFDRGTFKRHTPGSSETLSITIPRNGSENPRILHSCNGVLLLRCYTPDQLCVFNPITGETMLVTVSPFKLDVYGVTFALVVDLDAQTIFQFKIVVAEASLPDDESVEETLWRFTVLVPSGGTSWLIKSPVELITRGRCTIDQKAYAHGCVYYVDEVKHIIVMFNVEKETAKSIDWPRENSIFLSRSLDGSLQCVFALLGEIEIYCYDQVKNVWQLKHKIANTVSGRFVMFCNGQHLLIANYPQAWYGGEGKLLHMYDFSSEKWEEVPKDFVFKSSHSYFSFVPTLAKVSDKYLHDPRFEFAEVYLQGLQRLFTQET